MIHTIDLQDEDDEANSEGEGSEGDEVPPEHAATWLAKTLTWES